MGWEWDSSPPGPHVAWVSRRREGSGGGDRGRGEGETDRTVRLSVTQLRKPRCRCVLWDQDRHRQRGAVSSELFRHRRPLLSQTRRQETARAARPWGAPCGHSSAPTFQLGSRSAFSGGSTARRRTVAIRTDLRSRRADPCPWLRSTRAATIGGTSAKPSGQVELSLKFDAPWSQLYQTRSPSAEPRSHPASVYPPGGCVER